MSAACLTARLQLACIALAGSIWTPAASALDLSARIKWFGTLAWLPEEDVQRRQNGTPAFDDNVDIRLMVRHQAGAFTLLADHATTLVRGDAVSGALISGTPLDQVAASDDARLADLTWTLSDGNRHRLLHRFDRLAVQYRSGPWAVTAGRQAVSWGNGLVFQPFDLFNPFAPTTVDQDYKAGDDLLLVERALAAGGGVQLLVVGRRDMDGERTADAASAAVKWHGFVGSGELELMAARHYQDRVFGAAGRLPLGGALLRSDLVATRLDNGDWKISGIVNVDYSTLLGGRNLYLFAEYFHNGFGARRLPATPTGYPEALADRLQRGELFSLMRDYVAAGGSLEWHPLWTQALTVIGNLDDGSVLLQTQLTHEPDDHQRLELGLLAPLGRAGEEYGGVPLATDALTTGGGTRVYLRWAWYF